MLTPALQGAAVAALVAVAVLVTALVIGGRDRVGIGAAPALGLGYGVGHAMAIGIPAWPPADAHHWLLPIALVAIPWAVVDGRHHLSGRARWGGRLTLSALVLGIFLRPLVGPTWGTGEAVLWLVGLWLAMVMFWALLDALAARLPGAALLSMLTVISGAGAAALLVSGSVDQGAIGIVLTAALGVVALAALLAPGLELGRGIAPVVALLLCGSWLNGLFYSDLPRVSGLLLAMAPGAAWVGRIGPIRRLGPRALSLFCAGAALVPAGIAAALALAASPPLEGG